MKHLFALFIAIALPLAVLAGAPFSLEGVKVEGSSDSFAEKLIADCGMQRVETRQYNQRDRNIHRIRLKGSVGGFEDCLVDIVSHREDSIDMISVIFPDLPTFELSKGLYDSIKNNLVNTYSVEPGNIRTNEHISRNPGATAEGFRSHRNNWSSCIELGQDRFADVRVSGSHRNDNCFSVVVAYFTGADHSHSKAHGRPGVRPHRAREGRPQRERR